MLARSMIELTFSTTPCHVGVTNCSGSQKFTQFLFSAFYLLRNFFASQHVTRIYFGHGGYYFSLFLPQIIPLNTTGIKLVMISKIVCAYGYLPHSLTYTILNSANPMCFCVPCDSYHTQRLLL